MQRSGITSKLVLVKKKKNNNWWMSNMSIKYAISHMYPKLVIKEGNLNLFNNNNNNNLANMAPRAGSIPDMYHIYRNN